MNSAHEFRTAIEEILVAEWLDAWNRLRWACTHFALGGASRAAVTKALDRVRSVYASAAIFGVDLKPVFRARPQSEVTTIFDAVQRAGVQQKPAA